MDSEINSRLQTMDGLLFLAINGNDFAKKKKTFSDFRDGFLFGMAVKRNYIFGRLLLILGFALLGKWSIAYSIPIIF